MNFQCRQLTKPLCVTNLKNSFYLIANFLYVQLKSKTFWLYSPKTSQIGLWRILKISWESDPGISQYCSFIIPKLALQIEIILHRFSKGDPLILALLVSFVYPFH